MRKGRVVLASIAALLVLLVACVWLLPRMLDWNQYRDSIAALATAGLGRPVRIGGDVTLNLLPQPILTASGIEVDDTGDGAVLTAQELRLRVALSPLLAGQVDARDLTLQGADLRLPWPPSPGALAQRGPTWLIKLRARVEDSRIQVGGLAVTKVSATLATDPDTGTLSATGTGQLGVQSWRFTARLGRPGRDGGAGLEVSLDGDGPLRDTGGRFSGQLSGEGALSGRMTARGPDLSQLLPAPAVAWRSEGRLSAAAGLAVADELAMEIDGSPARGAVALRVLPAARLDLALAAGRLDLDAWIPVLLRSAGVGMPTGIDLSAEAATLAGGTLRRLRGAFDLDDDGVTVRDTTAVLPGEAQLALSGRIPARSRKPGAAPEFEGTARLATPDLRTTLRWLEPLAPAALGAEPFAALPTGVLRTADLSARVTMGAGQASLSDVQGSLDGNRVTGGLAVKLGPRVSVGAGLMFEQLVLDPWVPDLSALTTQAGISLALARAASLDADLKLEVRQGTWRGLPVGPIAVDAQTEATRLTLRRLEATVSGMRLTASATVGEGARITEGRVELNAPDTTPLQSLLPVGWIDKPAVSGLLRGPGSALLQLSGPPEALAARLNIEVSDLRIEAQPTLNLAARRSVGTMTVRHPGAPRLLETLGLGSTAAWLGDGSLSMLAQVATAPDRIALDSFDLVAGALRARGQLTLEGRNVAGQVTAEVLPLPLPYARSPDPIPVAALLGWNGAVHIEAADVLLGQTPVLKGFAADLALQDGTLRIDRGAARLDGGALSGTAVLEAAIEPPRLAVRASLAGVALSAPALETVVDVASGTLDATLDLNAAGYSPATLLATLSGSASLVVTDGILSGLDLSAASAALSGANPVSIQAAAQAALLSGTTPYDKLDLGLQARRGVLASAGTLSGPAGSATVQGSIDLPGAAADLLLSLRPTPPDSTRTGPELGLRLTGPLMTLKRTPELAGLSRWLADKP